MKKFLIGILSICMAILSMFWKDIVPPELNEILNIDSPVEYEIPEYSGNIYVEINGNVPFFTKEERTTEPFETYAYLDYLGRCGVAYANLCKELMPTKEQAFSFVCLFITYNQELRLIIQLALAGLQNRGIKEE